MNTNFVLSSQTSVEEALRQNPDAWLVFRRNRTDCLGCFMQKFCTLQDAAEAHQLPVQKLMDDLAEQIQIEQQTQRSIP